MSTTPVFRAARGSLMGETVRLDGSEGRHAALVRRLQPGERADLTDGAGAVAHCTVLGADGAGIDFAVDGFEFVPAPCPRLTVVQALPKGDRGEIAVETMTEVGVDAIVPWAAARSITRWRGDRGAKSVERWRTVAAEAAKQSRRSWWPEVARCATTAEVVDLITGANLAVVLHESASDPLSRLGIPQSLPDGDPGPVERTASGTPQVVPEIVLVVGPEGGISPDEVDRFVAAGALCARLGPTVLRTSTAGTVAAALVLAGSARWS